jgi:hypothetical protein
MRYAIVVSDHLPQRFRGEEYTNPMVPLPKAYSTTLLRLAAGEEGGETRSDGFVGE